MPKRVAVGKVTSDKMAQTRVVEIPRKVKHARYGKYVRNRTVCYVHDEQEQSKIGDTVEIEEAPPLSKTKRWKLVRVVQQSNEVDVAALRAARRHGRADQSASESLDVEQVESE